jgi:hypothetical protein
MHLSKLIESLHNQIERDFEWVEAVGASSDGTLVLPQSLSDHCHFLQIIFRQLLQFNMFFS